MPANAKMTIKYAAPSDSTVVVAHVSGSVSVAVTGQPNLTDSVAIRVDRLENVRVDSSPTSPEAAAQFQVEFETFLDLAANMDTITLHFDKDIGGLGQLTKDDVVISSTYVDVDDSANNETPPGDEPDPGPGAPGDNGGDEPGPRGVRHNHP